MRIDARREGPSASLSLDGSLDATWCGEFERVVDALLREGVRQVEVRCTQLVFVSSAGMGSLLRMQKSVRAAGGALRLTGVNEGFRQTLRMMKLESMLLAPDRSAVTAIESLEVPGLRARTRTLDGGGYRWSRVRSVPAGEHATLSPDEVLLGFGCLGHRSSEQAGELLGVGRVAVALPCGDAQADLLVDGAGSPEVTLLDAARMHGRPSQHVQFEAADDRVPLEVLLGLAVERVGGAACVVVAGELDGAVGASARRFPGEPGFAASLATAAGARRSLRWIGTPSFRGDLMLVAAVASPAQDQGPWRSFLRPHGDGLLAHAHGVASSFRPLHLEEPDPGVVAYAALDGASLRTVMHLVRDGRQAPAVQTTFRRGVLWAGPLREGGPA